MASERPKKPYDDFPLFPDSNGQWAKKVRGRKYCFGVWADWQAALDRWLDEKDALLAGRSRDSIRSRRDGVSLAELLNLFYAHKKAKANTGAITKRTLAEYLATGKFLAKHIATNRVVGGIEPADFAALRSEMAKRYGPARLSNEIQRVRSIFLYAFDSKLIPTPLSFGLDFAKPTQKTIRLNRSRNGPRMFSASEILTMLDYSGPCLTAMVLLGVNCGLGNTDCALLDQQCLNLKAGWLDYPRPKTGVPRRARLWPETVGALMFAISKRKQPKDQQYLSRVFITKHGTPWVSKCDGGDCPISKEMAKTQKAAGCYRSGCGFYALRHTFETIAGESKDQVAVDFIMGHAPPADDMRAVYRERMTNERLEFVANHVHRWLFGA